MNERLRAIIAEILEVHWKPSTDLPVVAVSWLLVVGGLYTATFVVGQEAWGGCRRTDFGHARVGANPAA